MTSVSSPPTLPPRCSSATSTESFMCLPMIAGGPLSVVMKPIFSFCCAWTGGDRGSAAARTAPAHALDMPAHVISSSRTPISLVRRHLYELSLGLAENSTAYGTRHPLVWGGL